MYGEKIIFGQRVIKPGKGSEWPLAARPLFHTFRIFARSCYNPFDELLMSFTYSFKSPFLLQLIFTFSGLSLWFATVIITFLGDFPFLVKIYFHMLNAFRLFCDNLPVHCHWASWVRVSVTKCCHRMVVVPTICDKNRAIS